MTASRRSFLSQVSSAAALGLLAGIPAKRIWSLKVNDLVPEADDALLRSLASVAMDAARRGGASFADIRVASGRSSDVGAMVKVPQDDTRPHIWAMSVAWESQYGIRVIVDNAWGFASGMDMTPAGIARAVGIAIARARASKPRKPFTLALAPAARVENGSWASPMAKDPFSVPIGEQADLALAALYAGEGVKDAGDCHVRLQWYQHTRVFASTEGSLITQRFTLADIDARALSRRRDGLTTETELLDVYRGQYGYEAVGHLDLVAEMKTTAERAVARAHPWSGPPASPAEVGRYDIVFGAQPMCRILTDTVGEALNLERALGYYANNLGTSFAAPAEDIVGKYQLGSPLVNLRADRTRPHGWATAGWDDEGVKTGEHDLIRNGVIVDYLTSRESVVEAGPAFAERSGHAQGYASGIGLVSPSVRLSNMTLVPAKSEVSVEDLIKDTKRGFYVQELLTGGTDQQLLSGQYSANAGKVREIKNGKLGNAIDYFGFQFTTPQFWKGIVGIGGPKSVASVETDIPAGPDMALFRAWRFQLRRATISAVPVRVRDLNVMNLGRTA